MSASLKYAFEQTCRLLCQTLIDGKIFNLPVLMQFRDLVYRIIFNAGEGFHVGHKAFFDREHRQYDGSITIGRNVFVSHNTLIDYTGHLEIKDGVQILAGTTILTHSHDIAHLRATGENVTIQNHLIIEENAYIGSNVTILASCQHIGKNAIIAAGAVVTHDVSQGVVVGGVPAVFIKNV